MRTRNTICWFSLLAVVIWSCSSSERVPLDYGECHYPAMRPSEGTNDATASVTRGNIYLDLSTSMQGYISDENHNIPFTLLQHLIHSVLQTAFHHTDIVNPSFYGFDRTVIEEVAPRSYYAIKSPDGVSARLRYNRSESNIVGVLLRAARNSSALGVIITDGLQDVRGLNGALAPGFDRPEFTAAVCDSLINKGFGIWLIGILNDFEGYYFNIIPDRSGQINRPIFVPKSKRPVYCWIVCKDIGKGRKFVQYLYQAMMEVAGSTQAAADSLGEHHAEALIQGVEISPGIIPSVVLAEPAAVERFENSEKFLKNLAHVLDWRVHPEQPNTRNVSVDFAAALGDTVHFVLQGKIDFEGRDYIWNTLPFSMWQIHIEEPESFPLAVVEGAEKSRKASAKDLRFIGLDFPYDRLIVFDPDKRRLELPVYLYADLQRGLENHWLKAWSTRIDTNAGQIKSKTLYLYDVVAAMLAHTLAKQRVAACLHLSILKRAG